MRKRLCKHASRYAVNSLHPLGLPFFVFASNQVNQRNSLENNQIELKFTGTVVPKASKKINSIKKPREKVYFHWTTPSRITYGKMTFNLFAGFKNWICVEVRTQPTMNKLTRYVVRNAFLHININKIHNRHRNRAWNAVCRVPTNRELL